MANATLFNLEEITMTDMIPDPYRAALDQMRSPAQREFLERRAAQYAAIEAEAAAVATEVQRTLRTLAANNALDLYAPPCGYCAALGEHK